MFGSPLFLVFSSKKLLFLMIWRIRITLPLQGCSVLDQQIQVLKPSHLGQGSLKGPIQGSIMFHPLTSTSPSRLIALSFSGHRKLCFSKRSLRARQLSRLWWKRPDGCSYACGDLERFCRRRAGPVQQDAQDST